MLIPSFILLQSQHEPLSNFLPRENVSGAHPSRVVADSSSLRDGESLETASWGGEHRGGCPFGFFLNHT